ncbi:MAG: hypothetical protein K2V38_22780, partial [Gemmataceae bacterium]|nr:hypothetical protein [Gemmataceae bacterium]
AVEDDPRLFQGLAFSQLESLGRAQEAAATTLEGVQAKLDALHATLRDQELPLAEEIVELPEPSIADQFRDQTNGVLAVSPDGSRVLGGSRYDGKLRLFDARTGKELRRLSGHAGRGQRRQGVGGGDRAAGPHPPGAGHPAAGGRLRARRAGADHRGRRVGAGALTRAPVRPPVRVLQS